MDLQALTRFQPQGFQSGFCQAGGVPGIFGQKAFPTGQVTINEETGPGHPAHRLASAGQQQAQDVAAEIDETRFVKVRLKQ